MLGRGVRVAALLVSAASTVQAGPMGRLEVGKPFPEIEFTALEDGTPTSLGRLRGNRIVLHVFASW